MKVIMLIGKTGSGKTSFCQVINDCELNYKKTQAIEVFNKVIDTPGEYLENRRLYKALLVTAVDADLIILLQDCTDRQCMFPPGFATMFNKPVIGMVTKIDLATADEEIEKAENILTLAGAGRVFRISNRSKTGIDEVKKYIYKE